ncbi:acyl-CoA dehydrogenase [Nocardia sp. NPDC051832]|uniref:acyl-CoA dehydrogenase n=1 Tax=Nocardia sp. NPDC051832 TaxID=3155673 RepID=UPI0034213C20
MPLAIDDDEHAVAESIAAFARRHAPIGETRSRLDDYRRGLDPGELWRQVLAQGLHTLHLPARHGGSDCGLPMLAVVVEQLGKALFPGPYLPTVLAGALAAEIGADDLLAAYAAGATGAVVTGAALVAHPRAGEWRVSGISDPAIGLPGADKALVAVRNSAQTIWFWLDADAIDSAAATLIVDTALDLTRSMGRLEFHDFAVPAAAVVSGIDPARTDLIVAALLGAEASGIAAWCVDTAVAHIRTRRQFGRVVASFQAVQHKAALMLVRAEVACAAAWDSARAAGDSTDQQRLAAAHAALTALPAAVDQALECVTLLGAIGFSWEHDAHLFWRRAISIAAVAGTEDRWAARLGATALTCERDFTFVDADTLPLLRAEVGATLDEVVALPDDDRPAAGWAPARGGARRARLAAAGLVAPHYPAPHGLDAGPREQAVIAAEFARRGLPQPALGIAEWVLPTLLTHGTEEQRARFVIPTLQGRLVWCQLFSEPGAGSDLAGLSTRARRAAGGWRLTGQKVWNTQAAEADWGVCLARTDPDAPKHAGLTYFLVDMRAPGVTVRPFRQATGVPEFNEVFLDEVFVADDCVVAGPGDGWRLAVSTLSNERMAMGTAAFGHGSARLVRHMLRRGDHAGTESEAQRVLGRNTAREMSVAALNLRAALTRLHRPGSTDAAATSIRKVFHAMAQRESSRALLSVLGPLGSIDSDQAPYAIDYLGLPAVLIGGGTLEIQLTVIAQRILGLPR